MRWQLQVGVVVVCQVVNSDEESDSDAYQDIPEQVDDAQTRLQDTLEDENSDEESDAVDEDVKPTAEQEPVMNPADEYKKEVKVGYRLFREHDKILQLKNQPDDDVFNGDIGEIIEIQYAEDNILQKNSILADFDGVEVEYSGEQIYNITHAYATSIHKAQGSEYAIVIMPVVSDYRYMLQKRLLYTGVTRARNSLVLLGEKEVFLK